MQNRDQDRTERQDAREKTSQGGRFEKGSERAREAGRKGGKACH